MICRVVGGGVGTRLARCFTVDQGFMAWSGSPRRCLFWTVLWGVLLGDREWFFDGLAAISGQGVSSDTPSLWFGKQQTDLLIWGDGRLNHDITGRRGPRVRRDTAKGAE